MTRRLSSILALLAACLLISLPAVAQTPAEIADEVRAQGYWIDPDLPADEAKISAAVAAAGNEGVRLFVVLLYDDPPGGPTTFADALLDSLGSGTVLVLSATQYGAVSSDFEQSELRTALDAGLDASDSGGDVGFTQAVVSSLTGVEVDGGTADGGTSDGGSGATGLIVLLVVIGGLVLMVVWAVRRQSKATKVGRQRSIEEARKEIKAQLDAMANTILDISDKVSLSSSREDNQYLEQASAAYTEASESYETATDLARLEQISDRLDEARWQLDAAAALADGRPIPEKPKAEERAACFFDPTHIGPFEDATISTSAGAKTVRVCAADADKLRQGQAPDTRMIEVGGRQVPAPSAPRSYGGGGMGWMDILSIVLGGMATGRVLDWGRSTSRGGGWSGSWGGSWGGGSRGGGWSSGSGRSRAGGWSGGARRFGGGGGSRSRAGGSHSRRR